MKKSVKRWLAISLMALMVLTMIPSGVFAVEGVFPMGDGVVILNSTEDFTADTVSVEDEIISSEPAEQNNEEMILPDIETEPVLLETNLTESAETETLETLETEEATDEIWETETYVTDTETENAVMTEPVSELAVDAEAGDNIESEEETTCATEAGYGLIGMDTLNAQVKKTIARAPSTTKVTLHPAVITPTGVKVSVGGTIDGKPIVAINGYDIIVDMGVYNTHNNYSFRLPYASELWEGVGKVDYISWTGTGSNSPSEGQSVSVANAGSSAYYYFKTVTYRTFTLNYNANGGTGEPPSQSYTATSQYEYSHTFSISNIKPTRDGYKFLGWAESSSATSASRQPGGSIYVSGTTTLFAVWEKEEEKPTAAGNSTVNITKTFSKDITTVPNGFGLQYTYTNLATGQTVSGTVPMTGSGSTLSGSISIPYYNNVAEGTPYYLSLTEVNADVSGYNLQIKSDIGQIDQAQKVISYAMPVSNKSTLNRTIENVYTAVEKRYTVTYTDGVDGEEIFADQVTENILSGTKTPEFEGGTPVRKDYVFAGWSPAVAETVTADATYTATWKEDKNNNGTPDDEEDRYTVTYTDGVDGEEIFADQVTENILSGTKTPEFEGGTPVRKDYVFAGWSPAVAETVTADATYTATWKEDKNNNGIPDDEEETEKITESEETTESEEITESEETTESEKMTESEETTESEKITESEETTESEKITKPDNQNKSANSKSSDKKDASDTGSSANAPKTGDTTDIVLWLCLMALAGVGVIFVFAVKRSRKSR